MTRRAVIATSVDSLSAAAPYDEVFTDHWSVARQTGARDLREIFGDEPERVDAAVAEWADWLTNLDSPAWRGVPLAPSIRADLLWSLLFPVARHAIAGYQLAEEGFTITIDVPAGTPVGDAVIAGARAAGGAVEQVAGGIQPTLPDSHKPVSPEIGASLQRYRALRAASPLISLRSRIRGEERPLVAVAYYSSLATILDSLAESANIALWPWALPSPKRAIELISGGGLCLDPDTPANAADLRDAVDGLEASAGQTRFDISGIDVTGLMRRHLVERGEPLMKYALYRTAAALESLTHTRPGVVVIPYDVGLAAAPLVLAANHLGIPTALVQHGSEASILPGDKLLASNLLVWSQFIADQYPNATAVGPAMLTAMPHSGARRTKALFLSYPVRHNIARDSWMVSEKYLEVIADAADRIPMAIKGLKIHPSESPEHYANVMREIGLDIPLISDGRVPEHLDDVEIIVGPESTGLLEAWAAGCTPICVNLSGVPMSPPFNGFTEIPVVGSADELTMALTRWSRGEWDFPSPAPRLEAVVGNPSFAIEATVEAIIELAT